MKHNKIRGFCNSQTQFCGHHDVLHSFIICANEFAQKEVHFNFKSTIKYTAPNVTQCKNIICVKISREQKLINTFEKSHF